MDPLDVHASVELPATSRAAAAARRFIREVCAAADVDAEVCETAALLTSELVTNAVLHGGSRAVLDVRKPPPALRVTVRDDDPRLPAAGDAPPLSAESGRGLLLVSRLADRWGVTSLDGGKAVWFELRVGG